MNAALSALLLLLPCLLLGVLILLPGLREMRHPEDAAPLPIDRLYARQDTLFAERFRELAAPWWELADPLGHGKVHLPSETLCARTLLAQALSTGVGVRLEEEAWARENLYLGPEGRARALVSDGTLRLGRDSRVERWVHGDGDVVLDARALVAARVTSNTQVVLGPGSRSQLIAAPTIRWAGPYRPTGLEIPSHGRVWMRRRQIKETGVNWAIPRHGEARGSTAFVNGDLILDAEADVDFPLVVRGNLYIRRGALIAGDIKAHGDMVVEGSTIVGNLCCGGQLLVGEGSWVQGCLRGDALVWLGNGVVVGRPQRAEGVVGDWVILAGTGTVHGRIRALTGWIEVEP